MAEQRPVRFDESDQRRTGSRLPVIGIHWPSAPWEDPASLRSRTHQVAAYAEVIGDPAAVEELEPLLANAEAGGVPMWLSSRSGSLFGVAVVGAVAEHGVEDVAASAG